MKLNNIIFFLTLLIVLKKSDALTCLAGKSDLLSVSVDCPSNVNSTTYSCASASYTLAGISSKVRLGCKENCVSGSLVPIDIQGIEAAIECCDEMYCNKSNKLVFNGLLLASLLLSFLFSSFC